MATPAETLSATDVQAAQTRPGMLCLLELLREHSPDRTIDDAEWEAALTLAEEQHVLPWAVARMHRQPAALPHAISERIQPIEREAAIAAFYWSSELKGILHALDRQNVAVVPLKGPFLAERLYGAATLRVSHDLDLLVSRRDLARAEAVLAASGFAPGAPDDYHRQWYRKTTTVELHHDVENPLAFDFHIEGALLQARPAAFQGQPCREFAPEDELLFLCLHAVRHRFERLSLIVDLQLAFEKLAPRAEDLRLRPEVAGLGNLLELSLAMVRRLQPDLRALPRNSSSPPQTRHLERLADRLWERLLTQPGEPLDWRDLHAFYLEIELPGRPRFGRRLRHLRILLGRVIDRDYAFAANLGLHRTWQARMLRPVRLLCERVRR